MKVRRVLVTFAVFFTIFCCLVGILGKLGVSSQICDLIIRMAAGLAVLLGHRSLSSLFDFAKPFRLSNAPLALFFMVGLPTLTIIMGGFVESFYYGLGPAMD